MLSKLVNTLGVSYEYLTNGTSEELAENILGDIELLNLFKAIEKMNDDDKYVVRHCEGQGHQFTSKKSCFSPALPAPKQGTQRIYNAQKYSFLFFSWNMFN